MPNLATLVQVVADTDGWGHMDGWGGGELSTEEYRERLVSLR